MTQGQAATTQELYGLDNESRQMVVDMVQQLRKRLLTPEKILKFDREEIFPEAEIREMLGPEIGLQLLFIPEAYGGMSGGARDCCAVTRELSRICLGVATAFFAIQLGADPLSVGATEEQKQKWLGAIAGGDTLVAYAVTEPNAGSNLAALKTRAEPITDDSGAVTAYRLNGTKQFISTGGYADFVTVLAVTPEGPAFFVVEKGTPGFVQGKSEEKHGIRASNTSPLSLTDVVVPCENLIGETPGQGLRQANKVFGYTRLMVAALALGAAESALEIASSYALERVQFGGPLADKQGYTHKLIVPHAVRIAAATAYIDEVAIRLDGGEKDLQVEGSIAKFFTTEAANRLADDAMQALGGYGYICEYQVEKIKRDVKITCIYEGTSEIQQSIISTFRWKTTRKSRGAYYENLALEMGTLEREKARVGCRQYELCARVLNRVIEAVHVRRLTRQQHVMFTLAEMITHVEVGAALARKALGTGAGQERLQAMSRLFAVETAQLVAQKMVAILLGAAVHTPEEIDDVLGACGHRELLYSQYETLRDMDRIADLIFER